MYAFLKKPKIDLGDGYQEAERRSQTTPGGPMSTIFHLKTAENDNSPKGMFGLRKGYIYIFLWLNSDEIFVFYYKSGENKVVSTKFHWGPFQFAN